jgi:hypothetical protein
MYSHRSRGSVKAAAVGQAVQPVQLNTAGCRGGLGHETRGGGWGQPSHAAPNGMRGLRSCCCRHSSARTNQACQASGRLRTRTRHCSRAQLHARHVLLLLLKRRNQGCTKLGAYTTAQIGPQQKNTHLHARLVLLLPLKHTSQRCRQLCGLTNGQKAGITFMRGLCSFRIAGSSMRW